MTTGCENDELFREASCNGDIESLNKFLEVFGYTERQGLPNNLV
jgi:hypothetical protein